MLVDFFDSPHAMVPYWELDLGGNLDAFHVAILVMLDASQHDIVDIVEVLRTYCIDSDIVVDLDIEIQIEPVAAQVVVFAGPVGSFSRT